MFVEIFIAIVLGILLGTITGIIPGIHVNLLSALILSISNVLLNYFNPLTLAGFIFVIAITHTYLDVIPTTFLGIPEPDSGYILFPSQKLVLEGHAYQAIFLSTFGALTSLVLAFVCTPLFLFVSEKLYPIIVPFMGWILLMFCIFLLLREKNKLWTMVVFFLSGTLGLIVLSLPLKEGLFPLFSGFFGVSSILLSLKSKSCIPPQKRDVPSLEEAYVAVPCATLTGWISSFLPGVGPAQIGSLSCQIAKLNEKGYLILLGGLSTVNTALALLSFYLFEKTRSGVMVNIAELIQLHKSSLVLFLFLTLFTAGIASILTLWSSRYFSSWIMKVSYFWLSMLILGFIILLTIILSGPLGICILVTSTAIGVIPEIKNVAKSHMMGCLLLPVILFFLL